MKLSDISTLALSPGRYRIVATFDGDDSLNPVQAQYILTVNAVSSSSQSGRPVTDENEDGQKPTIVKRDPDFNFSSNTVYYNELETGNYTFDFTGYLVNNDGVGYNISLSEGIYIETDGNIGWYDSGTYTITLTSEPTEVFNSKVITMTLNITSKLNPQIEYHNDGTFVLQDGVLIKKYYNLEKRDAVYKFDLIQPTNPYSLPLEYKIEGNGNCYIDMDNNKVYVSKEGKYKVTATFVGNNTYRPSITSYILSYYENAENEAHDNQGTLFGKQSPNLSFSSTTINATTNPNGNYSGQQVNNPFGVSGVWSTSSNANITANGSTITFRGTGNVIVYFSFYGNDKYLAQTVSYVLHVYDQVNADGKPLPNISFPNSIVTVNENDRHEYYIQQVNNPNSVNVRYYCSGKEITDGIFRTDRVGRFVITARTEENATFYSTSTSYTLVITGRDKTTPRIWFANDNVTVSRTADSTYLIQLANCNVDVPITYKASSGTLQDRVLTYNGSGMVVITATTEKTFNYESVSASYVLTIKDGNKISPGIYFKYPNYGKATYDYENQSQSNIYDIYELYNPHNVAVRFYTDRGILDNETNAKKLDMSGESNKTGTVNIYAQSIEDDTYMSEIATYQLKISDKTTELDIEYNGNVRPDGPYGLRLNLYAKGKLRTPVLIEILRFPKDPNFVFNKDEWYMTKFSSEHEVNDIIYSEDGNYSVISARITFYRFTTLYLEFRFMGNEKYYETKRTFVSIRFENQQKDPEISFPSYKIIVEQAEDYKYVLQMPENPHNLDIVYWSSLHGEVTGNILYLEDILALTIYAKNIETDDYYSKTISYYMIIQEREKPSRGWHFVISPDDDVPIPMNQNNRYVIRDIVDANGNLVPIEDLTGRFSCSYGSIHAEMFEYDEELGKFTVTLLNEPAISNMLERGVISLTIIYDLDETKTYRKESFSYTQYIKNKPRAYISFNESPVNLRQVEDGKYPIQALNNPDNHPIRWTIAGPHMQFDDANDPKYIITTYKSATYATIYAEVAETDSVKATTAQYNLYITRVYQHSAFWLGWTMKWKAEYLYDPSDEDSESGHVAPNDEGVYDVWNMIELLGGWTWDNVDRIVVTSGKYKVSENRYLVLNTEVENPYNADISVRSVQFEIWTKEDFEHLSSVFRLSLGIDYPDMRYLFTNYNTKIVYEGRLVAEPNEEFDIEFGRWPYDPDFIFKEEEWSHAMGLVKNIYTKTVNEYTVLCGTFSTPYLNTYNSGTIRFSGNNIFYSCYIYFDIYVRQKEGVIDKRLIPALSFNIYTVKAQLNDTNQYLLQTLNKPADCEIDRWEVVSTTYGTPTIIDDTYVYFPVDDSMRQVILKVYTKENEIYKASSLIYTLQVYPITKIWPDIAFEYSTKTELKNNQKQYELPQLSNPYNLPVTWKTSKGTIENGYLIYDDVGTVTITVTYAGDDQYEAATTTCKYNIISSYTKQHLTYKTHRDITGMQVVYGEEYSFEILRWPIALGLELNENEWRCSWNTLTSSFTGLYSVDEGNYRLLMGKFIPEKAGWGYITVHFNGNDHFYSESRIAEFEISWTRALDLIDPEISFTESTVTMDHSDTHKYLIQTPNGAEGVTFNAPTTSLGYIEKVDDDYYVVYDGNDEASITISIKSVQDSTYYQQTISYTLNVEAKPIVAEDTQISFANPEVTMDYVWETNKTKRYKVQDLYNPWGLNVDYVISAGNLREEDDGYYIYYDTVGDIKIIVVGQSNEYYNGSVASYTMHIVSIGEDFVMQFEQPTVTIMQTSEGRYLLQQVTLNPEVSDIRDNIVYSAVGATIEASGDDFYIVYDGTGNLRVKALFESDNHYKSKESYYTLTIEEDIQIVDPDISLSTNNIEITNIFDETSFKVPNVANNSGVDYSWYIGDTQLAVDENGYFNYDATGDFVITLKTVGTQYYNSIQLYCNYTNIEYKDQYFTIESLEDNNQITYSGYLRSVFYSFDKVYWYEAYTSTGRITLCYLNKGGKVYIQGNNISLHPYDAPDFYYGIFKSTKNIITYGNIASLLIGDKFKNYTYEDISLHIINELFKNCTKLISAENLIFPKYIGFMGPHTFESLFEGCTSLTTAPTNIGDVGYVPLPDKCYYKMFYGCTSLTHVNPDLLPATSFHDLGDEGSGRQYESMFEGCTSLLNAPNLPAYNDISHRCYYKMFKGCTSLTKAPDFGADAPYNEHRIDEAGYNACAYMFEGCTNLNYVKFLGYIGKYTQGWLNNVSPTGTFVTRGSEWPTGPSGIPQGWTVINV